MGEDADRNTNCGIQHRRHFFDLTTTVFVIRPDSAAACSGTTVWTRPSRVESFTLNTPPWNFALNSYTWCRGARITAGEGSSRCSAPTTSFAVPIRNLQNIKNTLINPQKKKKKTCHALPHPRVTSAEPRCLETAHFFKKNECIQDILCSVI